MGVDGVVSADCGTGRKDFVVAGDGFSVVGVVDGDLASIWRELSPEGRWRELKRVQRMGEPVGKAVRMTSAVWKAMWAGSEIMGVGRKKCLL